MPTHNDFTLFRCLDWVRFSLMALAIVKYGRKSGHKTDYGRQLWIGLLPDSLNEMPWAQVPHAFNLYT